MLKHAPYIALALAVASVGVMIADKAMDSWELGEALWTMLSALAAGGFGWVLKSPSELAAKADADAE